MQTLTNTFKFYSDPGHGWLRVTLADIAKVGLTTEDFTDYSYRSEGGGVLYLEEDCDAPVFVNAWEGTFGRRPSFTEVYRDRTNIRSLPGIHEV